MPDLTILHTNDLHGKLTDRAAERIAREKSSCGARLLLDSGDAVSSGNVYYRPGGEPILSQMSDIGYDAMAMGNREFHFLERGLKSKLRLARFPVLSANLRNRGDDLGPTVYPSVAFDFGEFRVAIFGLTVPMITRKMFVSRVSPYWFEDPLTAAADIVPGLRENADLVIALTHIGMRMDEELARSVPGIDLVVGGHSHATTEGPKRVGETAIVQAGWWGHYLGKVEITISDSGGGPGIRGELIGLEA